MCETCSVWCGVSNNYADILCQGSLVITTAQIGLRRRRQSPDKVSTELCGTPKLIFVDQVKELLVVYKTRNISPHPQDTVFICNQSKTNSMFTLTSYFIWSTLILFSHLCLWIPSDILPSDFTIKIMNALPFLFMYFMESVNLLVLKIKIK